MADETPAVKPRRLHPNPLAVWTACLKTPQRFSDLDGRLPQPNGGDLPIGQDGWSVAFDFSNFADLADKLSGGTFNMPSHVCGNALFSCPPLEQNQVFRLAITVHGAPGVADVDGVFASAAAANVATQDDDRFLNVATLKSGKFDASLSKIEQCFHDNTIVFLMGCRIAAGVEGNTFLQALSQRWDGVRVAAISTIGFSDGARQQSLPRRARLPTRVCEILASPITKCRAGPPATSRRLLFGMISSGYPGRASVV